MEVISINIVDFSKILEDDSHSFDGKLKGSEEFNDVMDYGLNLLREEHLELKKQILTRLVKRSHKLEDLLTLGEKAIRSCLYNLEQEGFISRKTEDDKIYYVFDRSKILFKIQKELEETYEKLEEKRKFYTSNTIFYCDSCKKRFKYIAASEKDFDCCGETMKPFDATETLQNITKFIAFIKDKLESLEKI